MIYLVGFRATGKSTIGRLVARELGMDFVDLDRLLCDEAGKTVEEIVEQEGWPGFRGREKDILLRTAYMAGTIVATGGGAVLHQEIWPILKKGGVVIWLDASEKEVFRRLSRRKNDNGRPSLTDQDLRTEISTVLKERNPLYEGVADVRISTDAGNVISVVEQVIASISFSDDV